MLGFLQNSSRRARNKIATSLTSLGWTVVKEVAEHGPGLAVTLNPVSPTLHLELSTELDKGSGVVRLHVFEGLKVIFSTKVELDRWSVTSLDHLHANLSDFFGTAPAEFFCRTCHRQHYDNEHNITKSEYGVMVTCTELAIFHNRKVTEGFLKNLAHRS